LLHCSNPTRENKVLPISDIEIITFAATSNVMKDDEGHTHPADEEREVEKHPCRVVTEGGHEGYSPGGVGDTEALLERILAGRDALNREEFGRALEDLTTTGWSRYPSVQALDTTSTGTTSTNTESRVFDESVPTRDDDRQGRTRSLR
jgi:hypothetical protein